VKLLFFSQRGQILIELLILTGALIALSLFLYRIGFLTLKENRQARLSENVETRRTYHDLPN